MIVLIRIITASILALIILSFFYSKSKKLQKTKKTVIFILSALLIFIVVFYELSLNKQSETDRKLLDAFSQNKTLICKEYEVTQDRFNFIGGTKVFSAKDGVKELQGLIMPINECRLK